jgi:polar amino acid transport system substrate-binding protein/cystine transport system substrate-binding protein
MRDDEIEQRLRARPRDEPEVDVDAVLQGVLVRHRRSEPAGIGLGLIAVAAAVIVGVVLLRPLAPTTTPAGLPADILAADLLRIAVSSGPPQVRIDGRDQGFDVDVATEVGARLGVRVQMIAVDPAEMVARRGSWDVALDPGTAPAIADAPLLTGRPYLWRSAAILAPPSAPIPGLEALARTRLCVVDGSLAADWVANRLRLGPDAVVTVAPPDIDAVTGASLEACAQRVREGGADAVAVDWSYDALTPPAGLAVSDIVPFTLASTAAVDTARPQASMLRAAVDAVLDDMRADGTLRRLSEHRFAGNDFTVRP